MRESKKMAAHASGIRRWAQYQDFFDGAVKNPGVLALKGSKLIKTLP